MFKSLTLVTLLSISFSSITLADTFTLSSNDIAEGEFMTKAQEFNGFWL